MDHADVSGSPRTARQPCFLARCVPRWCSALALSSLAALPGGAQAQLPLRALAPLMSASGRLVPRGALIDTRFGTPALGSLRGARIVPVGATHAVVRWPESDPSDLEGLDWGAVGLGRSPFLWSPPRHLLMDRARATVRLDVARANGAGSGQGVVVGIVDSGVDARHRDLRGPDGKTRLAWWLDFASNPAGLHAELESALGCEAAAGLRCQVLDAADLDERLGNAVEGDEPRDAIGHGTMVAGIAAGNGASGAAGAFAGVAPEATLIAARVTGAVGNIADSDVVLATKFIFDRAAELGMPAVVNLSLGSDFGAHDGSSELGAALAELVGPAWPGRAIVVAGGNSGELHTGVAEGVPDPFGVHTEVVATSSAPGHAPLLTPYPASGRVTTDGSLFVWINLYPAATLSVGVDLPDGTSLDPVGIDDSRVLHGSDLVAAVIHGLSSPAAQDEVTTGLPDVPLESVLPSAGAAVVLIDGRWPAGRGFRINIVGEGRAELWVQSEGDLSPEAGSVGALFSSATASGTVTVPAAHPGLIAVGASVNRLGWTDYTGASVSVASLPVAPPLDLGAAAFFSSAGPNARGDFKPELIAPGGFVISAMSSEADPRSGAFGIFSGGFCPGAGCQVVGEGYALTAGTSMAAPMVSGAAALLLEGHPSLTQGELRDLLITGSSPLAVPPDVAGRQGGGLLDVARSIAASGARARASGEQPQVELSRLELAASSLVADASRSVSGLLWLRDGSDEVFDAATERIRLEVTGGELRAGPERVAPGLYRFAIAAPAPAPIELLLTAHFDGAAFLSLAAPIDGGSAPEATSRDDGGCALRANTPGRVAAGWASGWSMLGLAGLLRRRARRARAPLRARSRTP
jgi:subtilisin family serine protease